MTCLGASVIMVVDAAEKSIGVAKVHAKRVGLDIDYRVVPLEALADLGETFRRGFEHGGRRRGDADRFLSVSAALVKPGGCMVVATLNRTLKSLALAKIGAEYLFRWLPSVRMTGKVRQTVELARFAPPRPPSDMRQGHGIQNPSRTAFAWGRIPASITPAFFTKIETGPCVSTGPTTTPRRLPVNRNHDASLDGMDGGTARPPRRVPPPTSCLRHSP